MYWNESNDTTPTPASFYGASGWWNVPRGYHTRNNATFMCVEACPNADFSGPVYQCKVNIDGNLVFQDLLLNAINGN